MSTTIKVTRRVKSSARGMYNMFAGPDALGHIPGVTVDILESGEQDGVGLLRKVHIAKMVVLYERIVALDDEDLAFNYAIEGARPHFDHEFGEITFRELGRGSRVTWESKMSVPAGRFTRIVEAISNKIFGSAFMVALSLISWRSDH